MFGKLTSGGAAKRGAAAKRRSRKTLVVHISSSQDQSVEKNNRAAPFIRSLDAEVVRLANCVFDF